MFAIFIQDKYSYIEIFFSSEVFLVVSSHSNKKGYNSQPAEVKKGKEMIQLVVKDEVARPIQGDIKIELKRTNFVRRTVWCWWFRVFAIP